MNLGIGIDIIDKNRVRNIYLKFGKKFLKKILNQDEILETLNATEEKIISILSNRFCVKEAISKAIGSGISNNYLTFNDLIIKKTKSGQPFLLKNEKILNSIIFFKEDMLKNYNLLNKITIENISFSISISDEKNISTAIASLELIL